MFNLPLCIFSMVAIGGSRSLAGGTVRAGLSDEEIHVIIAFRVAETTREAISELFGSVKTAFMEEFDRC